MIRNVIDNANYACYVVFIDLQKAFGTKTWFPSMRLAYSQKNRLFSFVRLTLEIIL